MQMSTSMNMSVERDSSKGEAFQSLRAHNRRFLNGVEFGTPFHHGPRSKETVIILPPLMRLCSEDGSIPVVTTESQPTDRSASNVTGGIQQQQQQWRQRAYVTGFLRIPARYGDVCSNLRRLAEGLRQVGGAELEWGLYVMQCPEWEERIEAYDPPINGCIPPVQGFQGVSYSEEFCSSIAKTEWMLETNGLERCNPLLNQRELEDVVAHYDTPDYAPSRDPRVIAFHVCDASFDFPEPERCVSGLAKALRLQTEQLEKQPDR